MTRKKPTKRRAKSKIDDLKDDVGAGDDVPDVTITTYGVDLAENVDDVNHADGIVVTHAETCIAAGCEETALVDTDRCPYHYDGDSGDGTEE